MDTLANACGGVAQIMPYPAQPVRYSHLDRLKARRDELKASLAKTEAAIEALESNPAVADVLEKISQAL